MTEEVQQQPQESPEDRLVRAAGLAEEPQESEETKPRDERGRFTKAEAPQENQHAPEQQEAKPEQQEAQEETQEYKWDEVKDIKLKIPMKNGEKEWEEELSLAQLREERMLKADYTRKTQEIAEKERRFSEERQKAVDAERQQYLQALEVLNQTIIQAASPELANVDWGKLAQENPAEYVRLSNRAREVNQALERVRFEQEKVQKQQEKERNERLSQAVEESRTKLKEAIPSWNDDLYQSILKTGIDAYGFSKDEVGQVWDHRVIKVLHDAHQYRLMQANKPLAEKKVVNAPPVLKPQAKPVQQNQRVQELQKAREAIRSDPRSEDAAASLMSQFIQPRR